jgi:hypothetical protein
MSCKRATLDLEFVVTTLKVSTMSITTTPKRTKVIARKANASFLKRSTEFKVSFLHCSYLFLLVVTVRLSAW